ncbi:MAG: hypothetical protein KF777_16160 [Planctomycetaceae bacterium]|nr:hypothetical protein [Planctomycetaceae bacterium]
MFDFITAVQALVPGGVAKGVDLHQARVICEHAVMGFFVGSSATLFLVALWRRRQAMSCHGDKVAVVGVGVVWMTSQFVGPTWLVELAAVLLLVFHIAVMLGHFRHDLRGFEELLGESSGMPADRDETDQHAPPAEGQLTLPFED